MEVNGYNVIIEDGIWKGKNENIEIMAKSKAEDIISMYHRDGNPEVMIVGAYIDEDVNWTISIDPENKKVYCKYYQTKNKRL